MSAMEWKKKIDKALVRAVYFSGLSFSIMKNVTESFLNYKKWYTACAENFTSFKIREAIGKNLLKEE